MKITIIDYGMGNLASVQNMILHIGGECIISSDPEEIAKATSLILPGVGAFDNAMTKLNELGLFDIIIKKITEDKIPFLGICLGMQLLFSNSDEGELPGLDVIKGSVVHFDRSKMPKNMKVPHMGWNQVHFPQESELFKSDDLKEQRFYFVHSFHVHCDDPSVVLATTNHGYEFTCSVHHENIYACQFHPEKSHKFGFNLFKNFLRICEC